MLSSNPFSIGWFSTGRGPGSRGLLTAAVESIQSGYLPARIAFVFCNRERGEHEGSDQFMDLVEGYGLPLLTLSSLRFRRERGVRRFAEVRDAFDREVLRLIRPSSPDVCALAGYMLFTAGELCRTYPLLNLHPAPPGGPVGTWQEVIWRLIDERAAEAGAQVQLATEDWDRGPIVAYCTFPLSGPVFDPLWEQIGGKTSEEIKAEDGEENALFKAVRAEEVKREVPLFLATLREFALGRLQARDGKVLGPDGRPASGRNLSREIEAQVGAG